MYTLKAVAQHNAKFVDSFVDLKLAGWKSYESAMNSYTYGFFKDTLSKQSQLVEKFADGIKSVNVKLVDSI